MEEGRKEVSGQHKSLDGLHTHSLCIRNLVKDGHLCRRSGTLVCHELGYEV